MTRLARSWSPASPVIALAVALALLWPGAYATSSSPAPTATPAERASSAAAPAPTATTVRFTSKRRYVVRATVGRRVLRGAGRLPRGLQPGSVTARTATDVLGSGRVEVLVDYGRPASDPYVHAYTLFTLHRGKLRPVQLDRRPLVLVTFTEGGDDAGFRCAKGRLVVHWFHHRTGQGEQTVYTLTGTRLTQRSRTAIRRAVPVRPESCA